VPIALQLAQAKNLGVNENARLFTLLTMATTDAMNAGLEAKYHYEFWRPVTAIRSGDSGGNPRLAGDPAWEPLGATPIHPEYPCANCIVAAAAGTVMKAFFGSDTSPGIFTTGITRHADSTSLPSKARWRSAWAMVPCGDSAQAT
jgi:hypothetical protein